jgi:hypothetical protein
LKYNALNSEASLDLLLETEKSYIRFGNGESEILVGLDMATQVYCKELENALKKIINEYNHGQNYLVGLTNWRLTQTVQELKATPGRKAYKVWRFMRYVFWRQGMYKISMPFLEADMFREGSAGLSYEKIELLWKHSPNIIVVYNNEKTYQTFKDVYRRKNVYLIKIPDKNFYSVLTETQEKIIKLIKEQRMNKKEVVILVSAGPGSNVLCYNLCQEDNNVLCYDVGNMLYMHFQKNRAVAE